MRLPDGYVHAVVRSAEVVARADAVATVGAAIEQAGTLHGWAAGRPDADVLGGRGAAYRIGAGDARWVVRHYRRGGAVAYLLDDQYPRTGEPRPFRELSVSVAARARGVRTPAVVAGVVYPAGLFYRADLATEHVPDSADLAALSFGATRLAAPDLEAAWRAAASLVRDAANAGLRHPDLNLGNILISRASSSSEAWLVDLDRARVADPSENALARMIARLHRSRRKLEAVHGERVPDEVLRAFAEALRG